MLINLDYLVQKYNIKFSGILHIGAHECEEIVFYDKYIGRDNVLWIDAIDKKVEISKNKFENILIEHAAVSDVSEPIIFNITNNGQSSSILELDKHLSYYPHITVSQKIEMNSVITKDILEKYNIKFNFVNLDIQGAELKALKGMEKYLYDIDYIYTEVNIASLYKGCVLLDELDNYLSKFGFVRKETQMTEQEWGDAFYIKEKKEEYYISAKICGGLGNQLFQMACVYSLAHEYNLTPIFKKMDSSPSVFKNRSVYFDTLLKNINLLNESDYNNIKFTVIKEESFKYKHIDLEDRKSYLLDGYYQSPKYFKNYFSEFKKILELSENEMNNIKNYYNAIKRNTKNNTVSIHIRRGDYLQLQHFHSILTMDYYKNAISHFSSDSLFIVFSDDINWCKNNFSIQNVYFVENVLPTNIPTDIFEFILMSLCDHNIIANSSFSCWAAYLNQNKNKKIIAPYQWFVSNNENNAIKDIYDEGWTII